MIAKAAPFARLFFIAGLVFIASCKGKVVEEEPLPADSSYFSIRQFMKDQITTYQGQPYTLNRITHLNGEKDSAVVTLQNMDWHFILGAFGETDISGRKYLDHYAFNQFDDGTMGTRDYTYTAKDPDLFTRILQIHSDPFNNRITSIYIETAKKDFWGSKTQKLLYVPLRIIQIQEAEHHLIGKSKNLRVDFRFPEEETVSQL